MTTLPPLEPARAALERERQVRARYRKTSPEDPERRAAFEQLDRELAEAGTALTPYVRRGPQVGRRVSRDPVRVTRGEITAARKRVRAALNRTSGTRHPRPPIPARESIYGQLGRFKQEILELSEEHERLKRVLGAGQVRSAPNGGYFRSMAPLREESSELLERLQAARRRVKTEYARFQRRPVRSYADQDDDQQLRYRIADLRHAADELTRELRESANRWHPIESVEPPSTSEADPKHQRRKPWTQESAYAAIIASAVETGTFPTARQLGERPALPHYTTLRRLFGNAPLTYLKARIDEEAGS